MDYGKINYEGQTITLTQDAYQTSRLFPGCYINADQGEPYIDEWRAEGLDNQGNEVIVTWHFEQVKGQEMETVLSIKEIFWLDVEQAINKQEVMGMDYDLHEIQIFGADELSDDFSANIAISVEDKILLIQKGTDGALTIPCSNEATWDEKFEDFQDYMSENFEAEYILSKISDDDFTELQTLIDHGGLKY